jgi:hypothetical protein
MGDAGEMLGHGQAKAAYKRRAAELREQLEEARELNRLLSSAAAMPVPA